MLIWRSLRVPRQDKTMWKYPSLPRHGERRNKPPSDQLLGRLKLIATRPCSITAETPARKKRIATHWRYAAVEVLRTTLPNTKRLQLAARRKLQSTPPQSMPWLSSSEQ